MCIYAPHRQKPNWPVQRGGAAFISTRAIDPNGNLVESFFIFCCTCYAKVFPYFFPYVNGYQWLTAVNTTPYLLRKPPVLVLYG